MPNARAETSSGQPGLDRANVREHLRRHGTIEKIERCIADRAAGIEPPAISADEMDALLAERSRARASRSRR